MGLLTAGRAYFVESDVLIAFTVGLAMTLVVTSAAVLGGILSLDLKRVGLDPALMSGPFISTVTDSLALLIYFEMAESLLGL